ncbi:phage tail protein [Variovorax sp. GT1P44]|uniref:phage tail protein n=1 Tax=Variovorax sp. GT1P44 TaxID=3443742 RepID=UPI003F44E152
MATPDKYMAFRFTVALDGRGPKVIGGFSDVSGLAAETEVETLRAGGMNANDVQLAGATKFPSRLVLKRGIADNEYLWKWYLEIMRGKISRKDVRIEIQSADGAAHLAWHFLKACPVKWTGPELHASTSAVAFEAVELIHKGILPNNLAS